MRQRRGGRLIGVRQRRGGRSRGGRGRGEEGGEAANNPDDNEYEPANCTDVHGLWRANEAFLGYGEEVMMHNMISRSRLEKKEKF